MPDYEQSPGLEPHWSETIRAWAGRQPLLLELHAFGSRVKGGYSPGSDLDLAVSIDGQDDDERLVNSVHLLPKWESELQTLLPVKVDVQAMSDDDSVVAPAVRDHGILIFQRRARGGRTTT